MLILSAVLFVCVVVLLWAAFSIARHIRHHGAERKGDPAIVADVVDQEARKAAETLAPSKIIGGK